MKRSLLVAGDRAVLAQRAGVAHACGPIAMLSGYRRFGMTKREETVTQGRAETLGLEE